MKKVFIVLLTVILTFTCGFAATAGSAELKGKIRDSVSGEFVSGLKVLLMGDYKNHTTRTDNEGYFSIDDLKKNRFYTLNVYRNSRLICSKRIKARNNTEYVSLSLKIFDQREPIYAKSINLTGRVIDLQTQMPVHRAYIFIDGGEVFTITDKNGRYYFEDMLPGNHVIKVRSRKHAETIREIKLKTKEEYLDFELVPPHRKRKENIAVKDYKHIEKNEFSRSMKTEGYDQEDDYLNEDLIEVGFDEAVKKVVSEKKTNSVRLGEKAKEDFAVLGKFNDSSPTLLGPTGLIDITSADTLDLGMVNFGVGIFSGSRDTLAGDIDTTLSSFKVIYGFKDNVEIGVSNLQKEYNRYFDNNNSQLFHLKYNVGKRGPLEMAVGYSYLNDDIISNNNILNLITQYSFRTGRFMNSLIMNISTSTDFSRSVSSFVNIGIESKPLFIKYPLSYMIEMEQNDNKEFKILNLGLRLKKNPSFDLVYRKEIDSSNQMLGLGSNVRF